MAHPTPPLGDVPVDTFLARHWQRRPLLIRDAVPDIDGFVTMQTLRRLAASDDVESRLVHGPAAGPARRGSKPASWRLAHGPFDRLPALSRPGWTLLVQGLDTHLDEARALMDRFRFIPDARLDDLMLSVASDAGGVGPHVDAYDVFLLQVHGRREWRVGSPRGIRCDAGGNPTTVSGTPLRQIEHFDVESTWTLAPGDMLYLPPGWAHDGIARGVCMTCSIGFRSPSRDELLRAFHGWLSDRDRPDGVPSPRYRDRQREASRHPARLPADMAATLGGWLRSFRPAAADVEQFLGCWLTEPKPNVWFDADDRRQLDARAIRLDRRTRMLYRAGRVFINGEHVSPPAASRPTLVRLADRRMLATVDVGAAVSDPWLALTLGGWLKAGWIEHAGK
ncbi:MAG: cupin domain-containing protein [Lautropia sp.]